MEYEHVAVIFSDRAFAIEEPVWVGICAQGGRKERFERCTHHHAHLGLVISAVLQSSFHVTPCARRDDNGSTPSFFQQMTNRLRIESDGQQQTLRSTKVSER